MITIYGRKSGYNSAGLNHREISSLGLRQADESTLTSACMELQNLWPRSKAFGQNFMVALNVNTVSLTSQRILSQTLMPQSLMAIDSGSGKLRGYT
jgi:EAL domain-containing protein (putative c-di-GMP-specific phosphodiesterase class I)